MTFLHLKGLLREAYKVVEISPMSLPRTSLLERMDRALAGSPSEVPRHPDTLRLDAIEKWTGAHLIDWSTNRNGNPWTTEPAIDGVDLSFEGTTLRESIDAAIKGMASYPPAPGEQSPGPRPLIERSREWWAARAEAEGDSAVGAGPDLWLDSFVEAVRRLTFQARTSGGTAGRDEGLCAALDPSRGCCHPRLSPCPRLLNP